MTVSVIGADGRRVLRGVDAQYAKEFAARVTADTGEELELADDDGDLVVTGIRQRLFAGATPADADADETPADPQPEPEPEPKPAAPKRRRRTP